MVLSVNYCSSCGHLSPPKWESCHHCDEGFEGETVWADSRLNDYYRALEAGYGRYLVFGYFATIVGFISIVVGAFLFDAAPEPNTGVFVDAAFLLGFAGVLGGLSLSIGSWSVLTEGLDGDDPKLGRTVLKGLVLLIIMAVILLILSAIPVVNALLALGLVCYAFATPWFVYQFHKRTRVDRAAAVDGLLTHGIRDRQIRDTALSILASTPEGDVRPADRDILRDQLEMSLSRAFALVSSEQFLASAVRTHQNAPEAEKRDLLEGVLEIGEDLRTEQKYEQAIVAFDAADRLRQEIDLGDYREEIEDNRRQAATAVIENRIDSLERLLDRLVQAGRALAEAGELEQALACYDAAELLADALDLDGESDELSTRRDRIETEMSVSQFEDSVGELFDLLRSAERAVDAGQYETAIQRFRAIDDRLIPSVPGGGEREATHQELVSRLDSGFAMAGRQHLLDLLPGSPTEFERQLLTDVLPDPVRESLDSIYEGTLEKDRYPELLDQELLAATERATDLVERYRDARDRIESATALSGPYLDRLDEIVGSTAQSPEDAIRSGESFAAVLERLDRLDADDPDQSIADWANVVRSTLRTRETLREVSTFTEARALVDSMGTVDEYQRAFPSLAIGAIVDEVRERIEDGESLNPEVFSSELERIDRLVEQEIETLTNELEAFIAEWRRHPAVDARKWRRAIEEARESGDPDPVLEPYRRMQKMKGSMWSHDDLYQFSWEAFEQLVANLYEQRGYDTTVTSGSRDMGVDVWAENDSERVAIQVKQFAEGNTVGREVIQKLESTIARGDADRIVIVTSSSFAATAERYAANSSAVELVDGDDLVADLTRYNVPTVG